VQIEIQGQASGRSLFISYNDKDLDETLLFFLRKNNVTIASSCDGEGVCKKCVIQNDWPTCKLTLKEFLQRQPNGIIIVGYL
jgi:Na+-transporting NADH:ubiquinone oxidoreductase subunit NqrF